MSHGSIARRFANGGQPLHIGVFQTSLISRRADVTTYYECASCHLVAPVADVKFPCARCGGAHGQVLPAERVRVADDGTVVRISQASFAGTAGRGA